MRGSPVRRVVAGLVLAGLLTPLLSGCVKDSQPPGPDVSPPTGLSLDAANHSVAVRDLSIVDSGPGGYRAGSPIPLAMQLWNNTDKEIWLTGVTDSSGSTAMLVINGSPVPSPAGPAQASGTTGGVPMVPVPAGSSVRLSRSDGRYLELRCLPADLPAGTPLQLTLRFDNGVALNANVPMAGAYPPVPASAAKPAVSAAGSCA